MVEEGDNKITWITCPECGAKIGIILSIGKAVPEMPSTEPEAKVPTNVRERLATAGADLSLVDVEEGGDVIIVRPKRYLGDLWMPINDAVRALGGFWIREGGKSRWEIRKEDLQ